jgi:hypothetical protein
MKPTAIACLLVVLASGASAQSESTAIHIPPTGDGFDNYLTAAIAKKRVPATVVERADRATLTLKASPVQSQKDATSTKVMKCVLGGCEGIDGRASASVKLVDREGTVVWSYSVNGDRDEQSRMAEAIAKHLKSEYFRQ